MNTESVPPVNESPETIRRRALLAELPVTNVQVAYDRLENLLRTLEQSPPVPTEYLSLLEAAREPVAFVLENLSTRFSGKPLPATDAEVLAFSRTVALWRRMADSYARVAQHGSNNTQIQENLALICQRCLYYIGQVILEHFRARREVAPGLWLELHGYFDTADEWGLALKEVPEPMEAGNTTTCSRAYAAILLVGLANPYAHTVRELKWITRWTSLMTPDTQVLRPDDSGGRGYGVDLMLDRGVLPVDHLSGTHSARLFDTSALGPKVKELYARLKGGDTPVALGLGQDCTPFNAARLLFQLYRPWCLAAVPRRFERNRAAGALQIGYGLDSIFFHVTGRDFVQPQHTRVYTRMDAEMLWTNRNQLDPTEPLHLRAESLGYQLDTWDIADQSLNGFRVVRGLNGPRIEHGQLITLRTPGSDQYQLGRITWLTVLNRDQLEAGIQVLPGPATGIALRPSGLTVPAQEPYARGFFLPPVTALKEPLSVIIPGGWHQPDRVLEVFTDRPVQAKLGELLSRGPNFDRCAFTLVG